MEARYTMTYLAEKKGCSTYGVCRGIPTTLPECMEIINGWLADGWKLYHLTMRRVK